MEKRQLKCEIKSNPSEDGKKIYKFIASTSNPDRMDDIIDVQGWDTKNWEDNPVILWGHSHHTPPIGRGVNVFKDTANQVLVIDVELAPKDIHPLAGMVGDLIDAGFLKSVSVGFIPKKYEEREDVEYDGWFPPMHFMEQELIELSIVSVPANPQALLVTNSVGREQLYERGLAPGLVHAIEFTKDFEGDKAAWLKEHDFKDSVTAGISVQDCATKFIQPSLRVITLAKGVKAVIGKKKKKPDSNWAVYGNTVTNNTSSGNDPNSGITFSASTFTDHGADIVKSVDLLREESKKIFGEMNEAIRSLAKLVEIAAKDEEDVPPAPDSKKSEGVAEEYLALVSNQLNEVSELFKK